MLISSTALQKQKTTYQKLSGVDISDLCVGFLPAFRDLRTDETHLSITAEGEVSPIHLIESLPIDWVTEWDDKGRAVTLSPTIIAGFFRGEQFFTLQELENIIWDA